MKIKTITIAAIIATLTGCSDIPDSAMYICVSRDTQELAFMKYGDKKFGYTDVLEYDYMKDVKKSMTHTAGADHIKTFFMEDGTKINVVKKGFDLHHRVQMFFYDEDNQYTGSYDCQ